MKDELITPKSISAEVAVSAIMQQMAGIMRELNLMSIRMAVVQNLLKNKMGITEEDVKVEWGKVMEEARAEAARASLVTPDGKRIVVPAAEEKTPGPIEGHA